MELVEGYKIPFLRRPPLSLPSANSFTVLTNPLHVQVVDEEIAGMLKKKAIEEIPPSPGYYSRLFVVTKKDGGWRPIINLKKLNKLFLDPPHFRMDTTKDVSLLLRPGDWAASVDLKDAYFHVAINRRFHRYLRFGWKKKLYQFLVLPFGLCLAPFVFTALTKPIVAFLRARGIRVVFYLDDILIIGATKEECETNLAFVLHLLQSLGFLVNWKKSSLIPSQLFRFLGLEWDTRSGVIGLGEEKRLALHRRATAALQSAPTCHDLQVLLGHMTSSIPAVPLVRLRSRRLQLDLHAHYKTEDDRFHRVTLSHLAVEDLRWILSLESRHCLAPMWALRIEDCDEEVSTDASEVGWGIHFRGRLHRGRWDADAPVHINAKELFTLLIFLRDFLPPSDCRALLWRTDSTTAIAYVRKEGGTISPLLLDIASEILCLAHRRALRILPVYVPSEENLLADAASRFLDLPDWHLRSDLFLRLVALWGRPAIDLFATESSKQVDRFFAWGDARGAEAFDALAQLWDFPLAYAFPPPPLLPRTIAKIANSPGEFVLVTPFWKAQKWFPLLLSLNIQELRRFPLLPDLVLDLTTNAPPAGLNQLHLVVWKISGGFTPPASPTPSFASSPEVGGNLLRIGTMPSGVPSKIFCTPDEFLSIPLI